ncbi:urea ABC transporter ATP-binding subunit UrtE [Swaminathania salitolerans]|uniref:ABC transporter ATP-binding protein n=1 Tax=Swaminathania salitolerans TaxID=182838 RepID=A0A511BNA4_9PROT|nr:urea ABC transporter ATP-binding subunit UrtE [Swaminathania salitolerans]GBQ13787.1 urea short-chain amide or branched-chain amino acid transporter ATP-binding protein [Swaminathania salitolerans LMG 21291]GEL01735.1 ABC transporter ATP-binding protein [Swaminathania salitolerans]
MLTITDIALHYGEAIALRGVSLSARRGAVTCLLGRNGVGKTSVLRAVTGMHGISGGSILWEGEEIAHLPAWERARRGIATVPQGRDIFPLLSVRENLQTGFSLLPRGQRRIPEEIFAIFPVLGDMLDRRGGDLSGGQQQQLAIARALVTRPRLLVLDEPTEGIQPSIIKDIGRVIAMLRDRGDMALLLVEQYFEFAYDLADSVVVLDRGQVVAQGTIGTLDRQEVRRHVML